MKSFLAFGLEELDLGTRRHLIWTVLIVVSLARVIHWFMDVSGPLPVCAQHKPVQMRGVVQEVRETSQQQSIFLRVEVSDCDDLLGQIVRLANLSKTRVHTNDPINVNAKLKRPWGSANPGGFNYRLWLLGRNVAAVGYVTSIESTQSPDLSKFKTRLVLVNEALLRAITLGDKSGVTDEQWDLFRRTGTVHLAIVSGLHVGVLAGLTLLILHPILRLPIAGSGARYLCVLLSIGVVFGYAYITKLEPPVVRAAMMFAIGAVAVTTLRKMSLVNVLACAAFGLVLLQPSLIFRPGYWLSFGAVAALIVAFEPLRRVLSWTTAMVMAQLVMFAAMMSPTSYFVGESYLIAPIANLVVVPLMTSFVIPVGMIGMALSYLESSLAQITLSLADFGLFVVMSVLSELREAGDYGVFGVGFRELILGIPVSLFLLAPVSIRARLILATGFFLVLVKVPALPPVGEFSISILDVGQGSAAIVNTHRHRLIVDTGPAYASGFDAGEQIVLTALRASGPYRVEKIIVSHGDIDHIGGANAILGEFPDSDYIVDDSCLHNQSWLWDGVTFTTQRAERATNPNDRSCAVIVSNGRRVAYLPGDIGYSSELLFKPELTANIDLLAAPHHGSTTSSHPAFVKYLSPKYVVFSAGFQNRYHHPAKSVVARYARRGSALYWTYQSGGIEWRSWQSGLRVQRRKVLGFYLPMVGEVN